MGDRSYRQRRRTTPTIVRWLLADPELIRVVLLGGGALVTLLIITGELEYRADLARARLRALLPSPPDPATLLPLAVAGFLVLAGALLLLATGIVRVVPAGRGAQGGDLVLGTARRRRYRVRPEERRAHMTALGLSGMGKSKAVASWVAQDILRERETSIVLDIHQTLVEDVLGLAGDRVRAQGGLVLEAGHPRWAYGFDPLWCFPGDRPEFRAAAAARVWQTVYGERWSDRIEYYLRSTFQAVIESGWTILEAPRLLDDRDFRAYVRERCESDALRDFFRTYEAKRQGRQAEEIASVQVRLQEFTADPLLRAMLGPAVRDPQYLRHRREALPGHEPRVLDLATLIGEGRPILADFPYRELGENSKLLAGVMLAVLVDLFLRRDAALAGSGVRQANVWADELQHYATDAVATIYTQTRKFGLSFCAVCTGLGQLSPRLRETLLGAGILVAFQTLARDAGALAPEMFWREFERIKYQAGDARAAGNPVYYHDREVLAEQADWLNKAGARTFWAYSRRRREDAVLLRTLDVAPRLGASERESTREDSGVRYGNDMGLVQAELRLRYRWLEERRYQLRPRQRETRPATRPAPPVDRQDPPARAGGSAPPPPAAESVELRDDPFA
jgi:hypothetical protein